ncbi:MAG: hypothetical protein ACAI38_15140 [Myxococcota bacterium]
MDTTRENYLDRQRNTLIDAEKRLNGLLIEAREVEGDEERAHDKELQDAKDLVNLAHRQIDDIEAGDDEAFAHDRVGLERTMRLLADVLDGAEQRLGSDEVAKAPDAQRHSPPRHH